MDEPEASLYSIVCKNLIPDSIIEDERGADGADIQKRSGERIYMCSADSIFAITTGRCKLG
jgi:hypothetical protein